MFLRWKMLIPKTDFLNELKTENPVLLIREDIADYVKSDADLIQLFKDDINLKLSGTANDCSVIVDGLIK
jgi:hypothetical protein